MTQKEIITHKIMEYSSTEEIAKKIKRSKDAVSRRIRKLKLEPCYKIANTYYFSEEKTNAIITFSPIKEIEVYKIVYITKETLIIPSKLNFLTLEQL